jgi:hypothetical protein
MTHLFEVIDFNLYFIIHKYLIAASCLYFIYLRIIIKIN